VGAEGGGGGGGADRSEAWDQETMFSQLAKRSSQTWAAVFVTIHLSDVDDQLLWNSFQNLCVFCRGKVSGERLISYGTYCQFHTREYSMAATSMKHFCFRTVWFVAVASGEAASCTAVTFRLFILGEQVCEKRFRVEC